MCVCRLSPLNTAARYATAGAVNELIKLMKCATPLRPRPLSIDNTLSHDSSRYRRHLSPPLLVRPLCSAADPVLPSFTGFYRVLPSFTGFYWVLLGFTGFYRVLLGFTGFYQVLPGFTGFTRLKVDLMFFECYVVDGNELRNSLDRQVGFFSDFVLDFY